MGNRFPSQVSDFVCNEEMIQFDKDNQGPDLLAVGGMISDELLSRTKLVWAKDCRLGRSLKCQKVRSRWCRHNSKLVSWHNDKVVVHPSYTVRFWQQYPQPSLGYIRNSWSFFFRLTRELVIHVRLDIWYLCWCMFRHGTRAPNHGPSTTIPDSAKAISMLADSGSVLEVAAVFYHNKFYIQCLNKLNKSTQPFKRFNQSFTTNRPTSFPFRNGPNETGNGLPRRFENALKDTDLPIGSGRFNSMADSWKSPQVTCGSGATAFGVLPGLGKKPLGGFCGVASETKKTRPGHGQVET